VFHEHGLVQVADLGEVWEAATGLPIPLGVIAADRGWPEGHVRAIEDGIVRSIAAAEADPARAAGALPAQLCSIMTSWCPPWRRLSARRNFARTAMKFPRFDRAHLARLAEGLECARRA
jgi:hypothetical protein